MLRRPIAPLAARWCLGPAGLAPPVSRAERAVRAGCPALPAPEAEPAIRLGFMVFGTVAWGGRPGS